MLHFKLQKANIWFFNVLCHVSVFILLMYKQKINRERNCRRSEIYWCQCRGGTRLDLYGFRSTPRPPRRSRGAARVVNSFTIIFYFNIILQKLWPNGFCPPKTPMTKERKGFAANEKSWRLADKRERKKKNLGEHHWQFLFYSLYCFVEYNLWFWSGVVWVMLSFVILWCGISLLENVNVGFYTTSLLNLFSNSGPLYSFPTK